MRNSFLWLFAAILLGVWPFGAAAQGAADMCVRQGLSPGSAAFHACLTAAQDSMYGMFDPLKPDDANSSGDAPGGAKSTTDPEDPLVDLDPLSDDRGQNGKGSAGWDWSQPRK